MKKHAVWFLLLLSCSGGPVEHRYENKSLDSLLVSDDIPLTTPKVRVGEGGKDEPQPYYKGVEP